MGCKHNPTYLPLLLLFTLPFTNAQSGDGGTADGASNSNLGSTSNGADGGSNSSANLSRGAIIAIAIIVVLVVVSGIAGAVLFFLAKQRQWKVRATIRRTASRVAKVMTPRVGAFSPRVKQGGFAELQQQQIDKNKKGNRDIEKGFSSIESRMAGKASMDSGRGIKSPPVIKDDERLLKGHNRQQSSVDVDGKRLPKPKPTIQVPEKGYEMESPLKSPISSYLRYIPTPSATGILGAYTPRATPNHYAQDIAILGGGISGLATAYNLSRDIPHAKITIFEAQDRLGGWVDSEQVEVDGGSVLFEWGPRSLRPDVSGSGAATLQLMIELGDITKDIRGVGTRSPAATNRYVYYPDRLVRMPGPDPNRGMFGNLFNGLYSLFTEPIFSGVFSSLVAEPTVTVRPSGVRDESAGDFIRRRYGKSVADNMLSALFHGIYAGDIYKLSARTLLPKLWYLETRDNDGNGINAELAELFFRQHVVSNYENMRFHNRYSVPKKDSLDYQFLLRQMKATSVYSFTKGLGQLSEAILEKLRASSNVTFKTGAPVDTLTYDRESSKFTVATSASTDAESKSNTKFDYAISSLSPTSLSTLI
ncbi:oxygen-dependent protoporphyrinogen oxidase, partial [Elasticomyces elasticus]